MPEDKRKIRSQITLFVSTVLGIYILDRVTKYLAVAFLDGAGSVPLLKNIIHLTLVFNSGAAFGVFSDHPEILVGVGVFAFLLIAAITFRYYQRLTILENLALTFILCIVAATDFANSVAIPKSPAKLSHIPPADTSVQICEPSL